MNIKPDFYTYKEYIKAEKSSNRASRKYNKWRDKVLKRDNYKCIKCGSKNNLEVHHIKQYYDNVFLRTKKNNGITLCKNCHSIAHPWNYKPVVTILRKNKISEGKRLEAR